MYLSLQKELELGVDPTHFVPNLNEQKLANKSLASIFHQVFLLEEESTKWKEDRRRLFADLSRDLVVYEIGSVRYLT